MKRVFLSFQMEDKKQVDGIRLLSWNDNFSLEFYDESVRRPYNSQDAAYIRQNIKKKIMRSSVTVGFLGITTYQSNWVDWELRMSLELGNAVILMGLPGGPPHLHLPPSVKERTWFFWDMDLLQRLIESA